jgi:hypothetical protein
MYAHVGDRLIVEGDEARTGLIIGVTNPDGSPPYIVKWLATGTVAMVSPGDFARVTPASHSAGARSPRYRLVAPDSPASTSAT